MYVFLKVKKMGRGGGGVQNILYSFFSRMTPEEFGVFDNISSSN